MDQSIKFLQIIVEYILPIIATVISILALINVKLIEREKSKLKKTEILFNMQVEAAKEFNRIYHEFSPLNLGGVYDDKFYNYTLSNQLISRIVKYQSDYAFLLENDEIIKKLKEIMQSLAPIVHDNRAHYGDKILYKTHDEEIKTYIDTLIKIGDTNSLIKKYMFQEVKR